MKKENALELIDDEICYSMNTNKVCDIINSYFESQKKEIRFSPCSQKDLINFLDNDLEIYLIYKDKIDLEDNYIVHSESGYETYYDYYDFSSIDRDSINEYVYINLSNWSHLFDFDISDPDEEEYEGEEYEES